MSTGAITGKHRLTLSRLAGLSFGLGTQLLFLWTAFQLFLFLQGPQSSRSPFSPFRDALLAAFFACPHSVLLLPAIQRMIKQRVEPSMMGCIHCLATCGSLLGMFGLWTTSDWLLWDLRGWAAVAMHAGFYASWLALLYSLWLSGMGYQTGLLPWLYWVRGVKPPRRQFAERGAFRVMRHPVYLSFLGLIWFTPHMSLDHVILTAVWTAYIYAGGYMKDRRLIRYIGDPYREYARRVPGFPIIGFGLLGRML